jgi:hypothetical protein
LEGAFCSVTVSGQWRPTGRAVQITPVNADESGAGTARFLTPDPIFEIGTLSTEAEKDLELTVTAALIPDEEIYLAANRKQKKFEAEAQRLCYALQNQQDRMQEHLRMEQTLREALAKMTEQKAVSDQRAESLQQELTALRGYLNSHRMRTMVKSLIRWKF